MAYVLDGVGILLTNFLFELFLPETASRSLLHYFVMGSVYLMGNWIIFGGTPAMRQMGLKVVQIDGRSIDPMTAVIRCVGYWLCVLTFFLGFLWAIWDPNRQGIHDKMAGTLVIKQR